MKHLIIPEKIEIEILGTDNNSIHQENILIGIHTSAAGKSSFDLFPFISDRNGHYSITKEQIKTRAAIVAGYSLMEYLPLESANPDIRIYFMGNDALDRCIAGLQKNLHDKEQKRYIDKTYRLKQKYNASIDEMEIREREELHLFETSFNRTTEIRNNIILAEDLWDEQSNEKRYVVTLTT